VWVGKPLPRKEDERLLSGRGAFTDDLSLPGEAHACIVRSPHAHARIRAIDSTAALAVPGVLAVLVGSDAAADGLKPIPFRPISPNPHEVPLKGSFPPFPVLSADEVCFVGEAVAVVVAETRALARDAAERVEVDYQPLELADHACVDIEVGDAAAVAAAFAGAAHVVRFETRLNRVTGVPLEPRCTLAVYEAGRYTLHATSAWVQRHRADLATVLGVPEDAVRVVTRELGGSYGTRNNFYPEYALTAWAAKRVGRPVKCLLERHECFLSDDHSRDLAVQAELALDREGRFLAFRTFNTSNLGAHAISTVPLSKGVGVSTSVYRVPAVQARARAVLSNTTPTSAYRAAGRPEVMFVMERLMDIAALQFGIDRVELRSRNLLRPDELPYTTPLGKTFDSGEYQSAMDKAMEMADWRGFPARRENSKRRGKLRGIGLSVFVEPSGGGASPKEEAAIKFGASGDAELHVLCGASGQGHETMLPQIVSEVFGMSPEKIVLKASDPDGPPLMGGGTVGSRTMMSHGGALFFVAQKVVEKGRELAAKDLEVSPQDVEFSEGEYRVKGTDVRMKFSEVARRHGSALDTKDSIPTPVAFPGGAHVAEVEIDPETGEIDLVRYTGVDDCGRILNHVLVDGQLHGGIVQGLGQIFCEQVIYDRQSGQLLTGTFMDYAMPRAEILKRVELHDHSVPSPSNPLGVKGAGEAGTTGALPAVANAVIDALRPLGIHQLDFPYSPDRVWSAIHGRG